MQRKFVSSLLLLLFLNFLVKPFWIFGIDLTVQNRVGAEAYGLYSAIFSFTLVFNIILDLGLTHYNNTSIARDERELAHNFSRLTTLKFFLGLLYISVSLIAGFFLGYTTQAFYLLLTLSVSQFLASLLLFLRSNLSGLQLFRTDALMSILDKVLMILTCGILLFANVLPGEFTVLHFALAQMASYFVATLVGFLMVLGKAGFFRITFSPGRFWINLKRGFPYALLIFLMAMYTRVDSIMLEQIAGSFENGVYAQAFRLLDVVNQIGYLFSVILLPMFSRMFSKRDSIADLTRLAFNIVLVTSVAISFTGVAFASPVMNFLYVAHAGLSIPVFRLLIISSIAFATTYVFGTLLTAQGNLRTLNIVAVSGFLLNVLLNAILIPEYGARGAAVATVCTQFLTAGVQTWLGLRLVSVRFDRIYWIRLSFFTLGSILITSLFYRFSANTGWLLWFLLNGMLILALSLLMRLFNLKAAIDLVRSRFR